MKTNSAISAPSFLVLMDFSDASYMALKYTISLAKLLNGNIHVLHMANPMRVVDSDNPSLALSTLQKASRKNERTLKSIVEIITAEGIDATSSYTLGNITYEFEKHVESTKPNLVIIGKKVDKPKFSGKLTSYLMNRYDGSLLIVGEEGEFQTDTKISLGCNSDTLGLSNLEMIYSLNEYTENPLTFVEVKKSVDSDPENNLPHGWKSFYEKDQNIQFECQNDSTVVKGLVNHISKNNSKLLCIGMGKQKNFLHRMFNNQVSITSEVVNKVNIPVLVMGAK